MADTDVTPFRVEIPQAEVDELRDRLARTRWPVDQDLDGERGIPIEPTRRLVEHMAGAWDWREHEAALNRFDQVTTTIDGTRIHAVHARSADPDATCLVLAARVAGVGRGVPAGGRAADRGRARRRPVAARVRVLRPDADRGLDLPAHGPGGRRADGPARLHLLRRARRRLGLAGGARPRRPRPRPRPGDPRDDDDGSRARRRRRRRPGGRPGERFRDWTDPASDVLGPQLLDQVLANIAVYWFTGTAGSSSQLYWERREHPGDEWSTTVPTGVCVLPHDLRLPVRAAVEAAVDLVSWTELPRGGHFPGIEVPDLLVEELRRFLTLVAP